jgi:hypothetical protein
MILVVELGLLDLFSITSPVMASFGLVWDLDQSCLTRTQNIASRCPPFTINVFEATHGQDRNLR